MDASVFDTKKQNMCVSRLWLALLLSAPPLAQKNALIKCKQSKRWFCVAEPYAHTHRLECGTTILTGPHTTLHDSWWESMWLSGSETQRLYRGDDLKNRELVQPNVEILHDAMSAYTLLVARVEELSIQQLMGLALAWKAQASTIYWNTSYANKRTLQSAIHEQFTGKRCIAAMTRSSPICAGPYADMVRKYHIAEGTDFDAEQRAQEMWSLLYSLTPIMKMMQASDCIEETILRIANSFNPMWKYSTMQRA